MAAKRLPFVSYSKGEYRFEVDERGFGELEEAYQTLIPDAARKPLLAIGADYLDNRQAEFSWQSWKDVQAELPPFRAAASALWKIAYGEGSLTDAKSHFDGLLYRHLEEQLVSVMPARGDLRILTADDDDKGWVSFNEKFEIPEGGYALCLSPQVVASLAMSLTVAVNKTEKEIEAGIKDPTLERPRQTAIDTFILQLRDWAETFGLPRSPYINGEFPAKFARFACRLLQFAPEECRDGKFSTDAAMAAQIRRARAAAKRREREQKQQALLAGDAPLGSE
jgi:hypothetical protein